MVSQDRLKELLRYNPETGEFIWRIARGKRAEGSVAGRRLVSGYQQIQIEGRLYYAHRLAWLYMTGTWPADQIDHVNLQKDDNRWANLREASRYQNGMNREVARNNTSGIKGVSALHDGKFEARIRVNKRRKYLGTFDCAELAALVYSEHAAKYHGAFARIGD